VIPEKFYLTLLIKLISAGALVFDPATITIAKGETVTWTNNAGFPHNIVFDEGKL
jgi:plastocyanin